MNGQGSYSKGSATSAAKMNRRIGVHDHKQKVRVENGKLISMEELKRSINEHGIPYFNRTRVKKIT